jgi:hypothetical protein
MSLEYIPGDENESQIAEPAPIANHRGWLKLMRTDAILDLIERSPLAFTLATIIALRAKFSPGHDPITNLDQGEAFLGDFKRCGMSRQQYRTAQKVLEKCGLATFKSTSKGTIAKLVDIRLFDVLNVTATNKATSSQPAANQRPTTNKKVRRKEGKNGGVGVYSSSSQTQKKSI